MTGTAPDCEVAPSLITRGTFTYDSKYNVDQTDPFTGGTWTNTTEKLAWVQRTFVGNWKVHRITIKSASSDVTYGLPTKISVQLRTPDGNWQPVKEVANQCIGYRDYPPLDYELPEPLEANAVRVEITSEKGYAWFSDIKVYGVEM